LFVAFISVCGRSPALAGAADGITHQSQPDCLESRAGFQVRHAAAGGDRDISRQLTAEGIPAYVRQPRGRDIYAACGQLKRTVEG
jgi:hypothetical protein